MARLVKSMASNYAIYNVWFFRSYKGNPVAHHLETFIVGAWGPREAVGIALGYSCKKPSKASGVVAVVCIDCTNTNDESFIQMGHWDQAYVRKHGAWVYLGRRKSKLCIREGRYSGFWLGIDVSCEKIQQWLARRIKAISK